MKRFYETYIEKFKSNPITILEIGSRDGDDAEALRILSSADCRNVYIVEPHPDSYRNIINKYPLANVYNFAISNKPGVLDFNAIPLSYPQSVVGTSSLLKRNRDINVPNQIFPEQWIKVLAVIGTTLLGLINRHEIDIVKIDVEGFTYEVLQSFGDNVRLMKALHLEVEIPPLTLWEGQKYYADTQYFMNWYGFEEKYYDGKYWGRTDTGEKLQGDSVWVRN
jgi:FkbM family methyltransferase